MELVLENLPMLSSVSGVLRWMFRFYDREGRDALELSQLRLVIKDSLAFISDKHLTEDFLSDILDAYYSSLYAEHNLLVSEEEFVFDFLNNCKIKDKLQ